MKDKKKTVIVVVIILIVLLLIVFTVFRLNDKSKKSKESDNPIIDKNPNDKDDDDDNNDDDSKDDKDGNDATTPTENPNNSQTVTPVVNKKVSKPSIALNGDSTIYVEINSSYTDDGATAIDPVYGNLTSRIVVNNPVNVSVLGTYTISYKVTNPDNQTAEVTRTIIVHDTTAPTLSYINSTENTIVEVNATNEKIDYIDPTIEVTDNSNNVSLSVTKVEKLNVSGSTHFYEEVADFDLSSVGVYRLSYIASDESGNSIEFTREYSVADYEAPVIEISVNGNSGNELNPVTKVTATDFSTVTSFQYAWGASNDLTEDVLSFNNVPTDGLLSPTSDGVWYLYLKASDDKSHTSELFVSEAFHKDSTMAIIGNFAVHNDVDYKGIEAGITLNNLTNLDEVASVEMVLYSDDIVLARNALTDRTSLSLVGNSITLTSKFVVSGTYVDPNFVTTIENAYTADIVPTKVEIKVVYANGAVNILSNDTLDDTITWDSLFII